MVDDAANPEPRTYQDVILMCRDKPGSSDCFAPIYQCDTSDTLILETLLNTSLQGRFSIIETRELSANSNLFMQGKIISGVDLGPVPIRTKFWPGDHEGGKATDRYTLGPCGPIVGTPKALRRLHAAVRLALPVPDYYTRSSISPRVSRRTTLLRACRYVVCRLQGSIRILAAVAYRLANLLLLLGIG